MNGTSTESALKSLEYEYLCPVPEWGEQ